MAKEDFLINSLKERILEGLKLDMSHLSNWEQIQIENARTIEMLNDSEKMDAVVQSLIENARLECQMSGKISGVKEIMGIVTPQKARSFAVDHLKL